MADFKVEFASNDTNFDANFGEVQTVSPGATPDPGTAEQIKQAVADYLNENPVQAGATKEEAAQIAQNKADIEKLDTEKLDATELPKAVNDALAQAKESGEFDGAPGKDGSNGAKGDKGDKGDPGYTPQKNVDYFDGVDGKDGEPGKDGYTPVKGVDYFDGKDGEDGKDGNDYILTEQDKQEIADMVDVPDGGIVWTNLGVVDDVHATMDSLIEEGFYRLSDGEFTYSLKVETPDDRHVAQEYWGTEELRHMLYFRTGYFWDDGELEWFEWDSHATWNTMQNYAPKNHSHLAKSNQLDFLKYLSTYTSGEQQITVVADGKSYIAEQYNYTDTNGKMIYYVQRYWEIHEPWKVYSRTGSMPNKAGSKLTWDEWVMADYSFTVADGKSAYELAVEGGFEGAEEEWLESLQGKDGVDGKDGYTPVKGVDYFDGVDGKDGKDGIDGYTPVKGVDYFDGKDGVDGKDGNDYILTEQDKQEIADMVDVPTIDDVIAALPVYDGEVVVEE